MKCLIDFSYYLFAKYLVKIWLVAVHCASWIRLALKELCDSFIVTHRGQIVYYTIMT